MDVSDLIRVCRLTELGLPNRAIARRLRMSPDTVLAAQRKASVLLLEIWRHRHRVDRDAWDWPDDPR
jgi:hypothetical protein